MDREIEKEEMVPQGGGRTRDMPANETAGENWTGAG